MKSVERKLPIKVSSFASCLGDARETTLKNADTGRIYKLLRKIIIKVDHTENRFVKKATLVSDLHAMVIELFVMTEPSWCIDFVAIPRKLFIKGRMAQAENSLM